MVRAVRFAALLGFEIEARTYQALLEHKDKIGLASPARMYEEVQKLFLLGEGEKTFQMLRHTACSACCFRTSTRGSTPSGRFPANLGGQGARVGGRLRADGQKGGAAHPVLAHVRQVHRGEVEAAPGFRDGPARRAGQCRCGVSREVVPRVQIRARPRSPSGTSFGTRDGSRRPRARRRCISCGVPASRTPSSTSGSRASSRASGSSCVHGGRTSSGPIRLCRRGCAAAPARARPGRVSRGGRTNGSGADGGREDGAEDAGAASVIIFTAEYAEIAEIRYSVVKNPVNIVEPPRTPSSLRMHDEDSNSFPRCPHVPLLRKE